MRKTISGAALAAALGLSGCGQTPVEQGALGGVAGAGLVAVAGGDPLLGAAVGAAGSIAFCYVYPERCF